MNIRSARAFVAIAVGLGLLGLLSSLLFHTSSVATVISIILDILTLSLAYLGGQYAKRQGLRPGWFGGLLGATYGLFDGISVFFVTITRSEMLKNVHGDSLPKGSITAVLHLYNSPSAHIVSVLTSMVTIGLFALIVGIIGATTYKAPKSGRETS